MSLPDDEANIIGEIAAGAIGLIPMVYREIFVFDAIEQGGGPGASHGADRRPTPETRGPGDEPRPFPTATRPATIDRTFPRMAAYPLWSTT